MSESYRILLADPDQFSQFTIQEMLQETNDLDLVASVTIGEEIIQSIRLYSPEVLLLSYKFLDQLQKNFLSFLKQDFPHVKTIILFADADEVIVKDLVKEDVLGCVLKNDPPQHLLEAIHAVIHNQHWFSQKLLIQFVVPNASENVSLTTRERNILHLLVSGKTDLEIAYELHISKRTVRRSLEEVYLKLDATSRAQAAYEVGIRKLLKDDKLE